MNIEAFPRELREYVEAKIADGDYADESDVLAQAVRIMKAYDESLNELRKDIDEGLGDLRAGRSSVFDPEEIIEMGKARLAAR